MKSSARTNLCLVVAALLVAALALSGCGRRSSGTNAAAPQMRALPVGTQTAALSPVDNSSDYAATLKARRSTTLYAQVTGYVTAIDVQSGDRVPAGQLLILIDPVKQQATVASQQRANAAQAATVAYDLQQWRREQALWAAGVATRQDLENAQSTYQNAKSQLDSLQQQLKEQQVQLDYYRITAPFAGVVGDIPVHLGDLVGTNTELTTLDAVGTLQAYVYIPVERSASLHAGLPIQILDSSGQVVTTSRIGFISPQVDSGSQTILVKADIGDDNGRLRTLQYATARVIWSTQSEVVIPVLSVMPINGQMFVFLVQPQGNGFVAHEVPIQVGQITGNNYVVQSGIKPGDRVITSNTQMLVDGMPVMPLAPGRGPGAPPGGSAPAATPGASGNSPASAPSSAPAPATSPPGRHSAAGR